MKIYDEIYKEFSDTRKNVWPKVKEYIDSLPSNCNVCDIGSGNGKNQYRSDICWMSVDSSINMCSLVPDSIHSCCTRLPFQDNTFDFCISIACIHHLDSSFKRRQAIDEIYRVLNCNGSALISFWGAQEKYGKFDTMIKWKTNEKLRYYYLSTDACIKSLFDGYRFTYEINYNNFFVTLFKN